LDGGEDRIVLGDDGCGSGATVRRVLPHRQVDLAGDQLVHPAHSLAAYAVHESSMEVDVAAHLIREVVAGDGGAHRVLSSLHLKGGRLGGCEVRDGRGLEGDSAEEE